MIVHSSKNPIILNEALFDRFKKKEKNKYNAKPNVRPSIKPVNNTAIKKEEPSIPELSEEVYNKYYSYFETAYKEAVKTVKTIENKYPLVKKKKVVDIIPSFEEAMTYHPNSLPVEKLIPVYANSNSDHHMYIGVMNFDDMDIYDYDNPDYDDDNIILKPGIAQDLVDQFESFMNDLDKSTVNGYGKLYYEEDKAVLELIHINKTDKFNKLKESLSE